MPAAQTTRFEPGAQATLDAAAPAERERILELIAQLAARSEHAGDGCAGIAGFVIGFHREPELLVIGWIDRLAR